MQPVRLYTVVPVMYYPLMHRTLHAYIAKEIASLFLLGLSVFTMILLLGRIIKLADLVISRGVSLSAVCRMIVYLLPSFLVITIPMAFLLAVLLAFGRLSSDSEITVMKSCGISLGQMLLPVAACAVVAALFSLLAGTHGVPWGNSAFKRLSVEIIRKSVTATIREKVFWDSIPGVVLYADHYDDSASAAQGVIIHDNRDQARPVTIFADRGTIGSTADGTAISVTLKNGSIHSPAGNREYRIARYSDYMMLLRPGQTAVNSRSEADMRVAELLKESRNSSLDRNTRTKMLTEFHSRFAFPMASIVFAAIGVPLGIQNRRSGKSAGFSTSIALLLAYYVFLSFMKALAEKGAVPPSIAVWTPNLLLLLLGSWLLHLSSHEKPFPLRISLSALSSVWKRKK